MKEKLRCIKTIGMEPSTDLRYPADGQEDNENDADIRYPSEYHDVSYPSEEIDVEIQYSSDDNAANSYPNGVNGADIDYPSECDNDISQLSWHNTNIPHPPEQNNAGLVDQFKHDAFIQTDSVHDIDSQVLSENHYISYPSEDDDHFQDNVDVVDAYNIRYPFESGHDNQYPSENSDVPYLQQGLPENHDISYLSESDDHIQDNVGTNGADICYPYENGSNNQYPPEHDGALYSSQDQEDNIFSSETSSSSSDDSFVACQYGQQYNDSLNQMPNIMLYSTEGNDPRTLSNVTNHRSDYSRQSCPSSNLQFHPVRLKKKSVCMTYILTLFLGMFGAHHFYLGRPKFGTLYIFTGGLLGMGYVVDLVRVPWLVDNANLELLHPELRGRKYLMDSYLLWLPPFGLLGFHHFYLGNNCQAVVYLVTAGALLMGWLLDACLLPLVWINKANKEYRCFIESLSSIEVETPDGWNTDCTVIASPYNGNLPALVISPPPYTEIDFTETDRPPSYNEVLAMDMQESIS